MTMTKKRLLLIAAVPLTIAVTLGVLALLPPSPGVTKANFDRIEKGMTLAEVEEIFGGKAVLRYDGKMTAGVPYWAMVWSANDGAEAVIYFEGNFVDEKTCQDSTQTILDKILRWLHLR
jgi:hypothetical protein